MIPSEKELLNNLGKIAYTLDKAYLSRLSTDFSVLCFDEKYNKNEAICYENNIRAIRVERWVFDKEEKPGECFKNAVVYSEKTYGESRFDFYIEDGERKAFMEVKGVTLELDGVCRFPDAPTERGVKHIRELIKCMEDGYEAYILFVIQMSPVKYLEPNDATHKAFGDSLREAAKAGVHVMARDCKVTIDSMEIMNEVEVRL